MRGVAIRASIVFVARAERIATLVLSKSPFTPEQLAALRDETSASASRAAGRPDMAPESDVLRAMIAATDIAEPRTGGRQRACSTSRVPTDNRPFFFNQLRFANIPPVLVGLLPASEIGRRAPRQPDGVDRAGADPRHRLVVAVVCTIVLPLRSGGEVAPRTLIAAGTRLLLADRHGLHVRGDLAAAVLQRVPRPSDLRDGRVPVQPDPVDRPGQPGLGPRSPSTPRPHACLGR